MADKKYKITFALTDGTTKSVEFTSPQGEAGKSAYEFARDGGYTGTEEEFVKKLVGDCGSAFDPTTYGLPVLYMTGDTSGMSKDDAVTLDYVYGERSGTAEVKWQGSSSLAYPKKNYTIKFDNAFVAADGWGEQKKYCLKANYIDHSHARNVVSAKLWGQIVKSRPKTSTPDVQLFDTSKISHFTNQNGNTIEWTRVENGSIVINSFAHNDGYNYAIGQTFSEGDYTISFDVVNDGVATIEGLWVGFGVDNKNCQVSQAVDDSLQTPVHFEFTVTNTNPNAYFFVVPTNATSRPNLKIQNISIIKAANTNLFDIAKVTHLEDIHGTQLDWAYKNGDTIRVMAAVANNGYPLLTGQKYGAGDYTITFDAYNGVDDDTNNINVLTAGFGDSGGVCEKSINFTAQNEWVRCEVSVTNTIEDASLFVSGYYGIGNHKTDIHFKNIQVTKQGGESSGETNITYNLQELVNGGAIDGFPVVIMLNNNFHGLYTFNIPKDGWMFGMGEVEQATETENLGFDTYIENEINPLTIGYTQTAGATAFFVSKRSAVSGGRAYVSWDTQKIGQIAVRAYIFNSEGEYIKAFGFQSHPYGKDGHFGEDALLEPAAGITHYFTNNPISIAVPNDCTVMWECLLPASAPLPDGTLTHIWSTESETNGTWTYKWVKTGIEYYVEHASAPKEAVLCAEYSEASGFRAEAVLDGSDFDIEYVSNEDDAAWVATSVNRLINACMNSDGNDLDTTVAQYLDWDSAIDYFIFKNLIYGVDIVGKNYILATYDGVKWFFSAYDLDSVFGLYPDGKKFLKANTGMFAFSHTVDALLVKYKAAEVKARYNELRQGVLSTDNVTDLFTNFIGKIPALLLLEDVKKWTSVPNTSANNLAQIVDYYARRSDHIDADIKKYVGLDAPPEEPSDSLLDPTSKDWMNGMIIRQGDEPFKQASNNFAVSNYIYFKKGDTFVLEGAHLLYVDGGYASLSVHFNDKTSIPISTVSLYTLEQKGLVSYEDGVTTLTLDFDAYAFNIPVGTLINDGYIRLTISPLSGNTLDMENVRLYRKIIGQIPDEYTQVEYIYQQGVDSGAMSYIDTGVTGGSQAAYEIKFSMLGELRRNNETYFGGENAGVPYLYNEHSMLAMNATGGGIGGIDLKWQETDTEAHVVKYDSVTGEFTKDGIKVGERISVADSGWGNRPWFVFSSNRNDSDVSLTSSMSLYYLKMYKDGVLVRNFVPVLRNSDDVAGLYDLVTESFYTNARPGHDGHLKAPNQ